MFSSKQHSVATAAVVAVMLTTSAALAGDGRSTPPSTSGRSQGLVTGAFARDVGAQAYPSFPMQGHPQMFAIGVPARDVGAQAYPSSADLGGAASIKGVNHVTRNAVPAYQRGFDTGSRAYPSVQ